MPITNYQDIIETPLFEGLIADTSDCTVITAHNDDTVILPFGLAVVYNTAGTATQRGVILPTATGQVLAGILVRPDNFESRTGYSKDANGYDGYPFINSVSGFASDETNTYGVPQVSLLKQGVIGVPVDQAITNVSAPVYFRHTAPGRIGSFRMDADGGNADLIANARWETVGAAGSVLKLRLNIS